MRSWSFCFAHQRGALPFGQLDCKVVSESDFGRNLERDPLNRPKNVRKRLEFFHVERRSFKGY